MPPKGRKTAAQKKKESEVTEAKTPETQGENPPQEAQDTPDNPDERPEADPSQPPEEQEENQAPPQEQPPEASPDPDEEQQRGGRKVGKTGDKNEPGPRGGRKIGKVSAEEQADRDQAGAAREKQVRSPQKEPVEPYQPRRQPLEAVSLNQHHAEERRQAELAAERKEHNERTGDASRASWG